MLVTILFRVFCFYISSLRTKRLKYIKNIILHVVLYGCEILSLPLREERGLRVSEKRVLRTIFISKRKELAWRLPNTA
jgi:hypothetical protein